MSQDVAGELGTTRGPEGSGYEIVEHTADVGLRAWGKDLPALFEAAARGLFALITDLERVQPRISRRLELSAGDHEELLHEWLDALNGLHQVQEELYARFDVQIEDQGLRATVHGEPIDPERHELRLEIKAVTWHGSKLVVEPGRCEAEVLLDI